MADGNFYIVFIDRVENVSYEDVKAKIGKAVSWYRITERYWVLFTTSDAEKWNARLAPLVAESGSLFICKLDMSDRQGWMTPKFWDWIRRHEGAVDIGGND